MNNENNLVINNEFDYSNVIPTIECVSYLVQYCDGIYKQFMNLIAEDEKKNEQFKPEYRNYNYKKTFSEKFEVFIIEKSVNNLTCKSFESFQNAVNSGNLKHVRSLDIILELNYKSGQGNNLINNENSFLIRFRPYEIIFARKSNHNDMNMNQIENNINEILKQFPKANSIFYTKD